MLSTIWTHPCPDCGGVKAIATHKRSVDIHRCADPQRAVEEWAAGQAEAALHVVGPDAATKLVIEALQHGLDRDPADPLDFDGDPLTSAAMSFADQWHYIFNSLRLDRADAATRDGLIEAARAGVRRASEEN